jgi:glycoprotein 2-beta-D-xylosyltransferase
MPMKGWTIAVQRYEYANLYHTMTDYYNAFLVSKLFNMIPGNTTIIWIDGHPSGALDDTWSMLFGQVLRAGDLRKPVLFSNMVWGIMGYDSPLNQHRLHQVPYIEEFRTFFLSRYEMHVNRALYCGQLNITFLWRRDYLAHPRNPSGSVTRKIENENELLTSAKTNFPADNIQGVQIDLLKMKDQLKVISTTDILIGMHGAGLSHTLFLPKHGGLIEIYPTYWSDSNIHFKAMAKWRQLKYRNWINRDGSKELSNHYTIVDTRAIIELLRQMRSTMCL